MLRRALLAVSTLSIAAAAPTAGAPRVEARTATCNVFCDLTYVTCRNTVGRLDMATCDAYYQGCLYGCNTATPG